MCMNGELPPIENPNPAPEPDPMSEALIKYGTELVKQWDEDPAVQADIEKFYRRAERIERFQKLFRR